MMEPTVYIGEQLFYGQIGHFFVVLSFVSSLLGAIAYLWNRKSVEHQNQNWLRIGRYAFLVHAVSIFTVIGLIFHLMLNNATEYYYVWQHVSEDLDMKYIFSAFWEGQEGSFLLWMFWHIVLGGILLWKERKFEAQVMGVLCVVQLILTTMILGIYFMDGETVIKLGSSPFTLLRNEIDAPIFASVDYLSNIEGNGLNPLLQNYWMTIHPPTLFLGFASVTVPFLYMMAGAMTGKQSEWLKPVLPWSLFSGGILGIGILMGAAWAYEALSFGGYWAWDPVENMSLVPWILLIAGIHTNLISRSTGYSVKSTALFYWGAFVMILYSTFLTRSGVLGDTSQHAFTEMGLENQLIILVLAFTFWGLYYIIKNWKKMPSPPEEEQTWSREFWMFIGSLVLLFSAVLITFTTSIPVYNKLFDLWGYLTNKDYTHMHRTSPLDVISHYNKYQLWIAIFIAFISVIAILMRYKKPLGKDAMKKVLQFTAISLVISGVLHLITYEALNVKAWQYHVLLFSGFFAIVSQGTYFFTFARRNLKLAGSTISHIGFGLMVLGIIASGLGKQFISTNPFAQRGLLEGQTEEDLGKNITLLKGVPMFMSGYEVTYTKDSLDGVNREYEVNFKKKDSLGNVVEEFNLNPNVLYDKSFTKIAASNPATRHYLARDIFTHIDALPPEEINIDFAREKEDTLSWEPYTGLVGDTIFTKNNFAIVENVDFKTAHPDYESQEGDLVMGMTLKFHNASKDSSWQAFPFIVIREGVVYNFPYQVNELGLKIRMKEESLQHIINQSATAKAYQITLPVNGSGTVEKYKVELLSVDQEKNHPNYAPEPKDIVIHARLKITDTETGKSGISNPLYVIRGNNIFTVNDPIPELGLLCRFYHLDPDKEEMKLSFTSQPIEEAKLFFEVAENSARSDFIVLQAILFPGINFFWLGSLMMMLGMFVGMYIRMKK
jgi:cytochrome c-type biogenesis protein CcmF